MARFEFSLEPVLDQRIALERQAQVVVARLQMVKDQIEERVRRIQAELAGDRESMRHIAAGDEQGRVAVDQVKLAAGASMHAMIKLQRAAIELAGAQQRLAAGRAKLMAARVAKKGVEVLKQRQFEAWKREQDRKETAALDDLIVMRAGRGETDGGFGG